jgi:hypothetical protein
VALIPCIWSEDGGFRTTSTVRSTGLRSRIYRIRAALCGNAEQAQSVAGVADEIDRLRSQVREQQGEIDALRQTPRRAAKAARKLIPASAPAAEPVSSASRPAAQAAPLKTVPVKRPLSFSLGGLTFTPTGFLDFLQVWRSKTVSSGMGTNFAGISFYNTVLGQRPQTLSSAANLRLGMRVTTRVRGFDILGLVETDFQGYSPNNVAITTSTFALRMRLAFLNARRNRWEFRAGQNWSLLTPAREGISPYPETLFLTQDLDPNVQSGLVWARTPQFALCLSCEVKRRDGLSFEASDAYSGGVAAGGTVTLPSALAPNYFGQVDLSTENGNAVPNQNLGWVAKIAFNPKVASRSVHFEVAGLLNSFAFYSPLNNRRFRIMGGGFTVNAGIEAVPHLIVLTNNFYTNGGGTFIFGQAPALISRHRRSVTSAGCVLGRWPRIRCRTEVELLGLLRSNMDRTDLDVRPRESSTCGLRVHVLPEYPKSDNP